ncbi:hypothetical protein BGY98DRAFT_187729 [Russula aff. rugulosa BPL654]|nr:hypothetical protein BGY98DRAFT_187729 [Russula aff. rugulosa BPL654]
MHRYRVVAQISLILSILNLVLAAPIVVQRTHEARRDKIVLAADVPKKWRKLEAVDLSPRVIPDAMASTGAMASPDAIASPGAMASPEHGSSSEESIGSGYHTPPSSLSPHSPGSASGYLRLFPDLGQYEPPHLNPQPGSPEVPSSPPPEELTPLSQHHSPLRLPADIQLSPLLIPTHLHPPFLPLPPLPAPPSHPPALSSSPPPPLLPLTLQVQGPRRYHNLRNIWSQIRSD